MPFNTLTASQSGKLSKRPKDLPIEISGGLNKMAFRIINEIDLDELNTNQKIKLLDVILKNTIIKNININNDLPFQKVEIEIVKND
jgi:hypothetical protein